MYRLGEYVDSPAGIGTIVTIYNHVQYGVILADPVSDHENRELPIKTFKAEDLRPLH